MPTNRQIYFDLINKENKYINKTVIHELLMHVNNFDDETKLLSSFDDECKNVDALYQLCERVLSGEPLQYVLGYSYFFGRRFYVDENVLIPRNETEELASIVINLIPQVFGNKQITVFDICTGSGILGITIKNEIEDSKVYISDLSEDALKVAIKNSKDLDSDVTVLSGDMCEPFLKQNLKADVIVCNPPYIPTVDTVDEQTLKHEPHLALFASPRHKYYEEAIKNEIEDSKVYISDLSEDALKVAIKNSKDLDSDVTVLSGDMCEPFLKQNLKADVIVCNPPYIPTVDTVDEQTLKHEPHLALFASPSHKYYEEVFKNVKELCNDKYLLAFEIGEDMNEVLEPLINKYLPNVSYNFVKDLYNKYRFLIILSR